MWPWSRVKVHLFEAVVQQGELLVPPHHGRRHRVLGESTLRLFVHKEKLRAAAFHVLVARKPAFRVKVAFLVCVLPLIIIIIVIIIAISVTGYTFKLNHTSSINIMRPPSEESESIH